MQQPCVACSCGANYVKRGLAGGLQGACGLVHVLLQGPSWATQKQLHYYYPPRCGRQGPKIISQYFSAILFLAFINFMKTELQQILNLRLVQMCKSHGPDLSFLLMGLTAHYVCCPGTSPSEMDVPRESVFLCVHV